ncbi:MAG: nitroreductase family protein, partial [Prevotella sp.]|nr:nitroreductase family protein [Prevotella sp.]
MKETIKNIITRRSVKKYQDRDVAQELIEEIVKAGTYAPTGRNSQSPIIIAVTNKALRDKLSNLNLEIIRSKHLTTSSGEEDPFYGAPVVLVVLARKDV